MRETAQILLAGSGKTVFAIALATALIISPNTLPQTAHALEQATLTIESKDNAQAVYHVYRIFSADISSNTGSNADFGTTAYPPINWPGIASHIDWASPAVRQSVLTYLDTTGYSDWLASAYAIELNSSELEHQHGLAQNAAAYITQEIGASANDEDAATIPATKAAQSFALELARSLANSGIVADSTTHDNEGNAIFTGEEGYYLFITDTTTIGTDEAGTSPIWVPLGGGTSTITEKSAVPTLDKQVEEDSTGNWGYVADAALGQDISYRLIATMPDNIGAFDTYYLKFSDTLPKGMELTGGDASSVKVTLAYSQKGNSQTIDITDNPHVSIGKAQASLIVAIDDLKAVSNNVDKNTTVTVEYRAHLTGDSAIGSEGNLNSAMLTYAADPATCVKGLGSWDDEDPAGTGETLEGAEKTRTCTWQMILDKADKQTHKKLAGAGYTIQTIAAQTLGGITGPTDNASMGKYVQADGSLAETPYEFRTDDTGRITVPRIDSGTYLIHETSAPTGYELQDADITLVVSANLDQQAGIVDSWAAALSGGETGKTTDDDIITHLAQADDEAMASALTSGTIMIDTSDDKKIVMPITGMEGTTAIVVYGSAAVALGLAGSLVTRRHTAIHETDKNGGDAAATA